MEIDAGLISVVVTLIVAVIGISFGYGMLTNKVSGHDKKIEAIESKYDVIDKKLDELCLLVQEIKGQLDGILRTK